VGVFWNTGMDSSGIYRDQFTSLVGVVPLADGKEVHVCAKIQLNFIGYNVGGRVCMKQTSTGTVYTQTPKFNTC
jgi:hypothetical protein